MSGPTRPPRPSWRATEARAFRPVTGLLALGLVGMLLMEVWEYSHKAELCLALEQTRAAGVRANARLDFVRADLERRTTRAELVPWAAPLGLAPAEAQQVVTLPSEYLADGGSTPRDGGSASVLAWAERASRTIVPDATARDRAGN